MGVIALIAWLVTAGGGVYLLAIWLIEYDRDFQSAAATRLPIPVISGHALLALSGLVVWGAYLLFDNDRLAWAAVAILGAVAVLGLTMAVRWLGVYRTAVASAAPAGAGAGAAGGAILAPAPAVPPERNFPVAVVIGHGICAMITLLLVVLTALGAWGN